MFVGYEIKQNQNQAKAITLDTDIKLSQAVLDPASKGNKKEPVCLMAEYNKKQFILAVLDPNQTWQSPLDLMFAAGTEVKFFVRGSGTVHVTGYEHFDDIDDMSVSMSEEESSEEEQEPVVKKIKDKTGSAKKVSPGKTNGTPKSLNGKKNGKVPHVAGDEAEEDDDDDDDESDLDFNEDDSDDDDEISNDDEDLDDDDDEEDDDEDLDEDMLEELDSDDDDED